ncbi:tetratricopeptide repeat protein [Saccharomonospora xinjiangensis]|uniref:tetratricopeptide repeat protein n=1 Tax=Saccharomonospora xinjiangensis TaxID=75294 RepID=UPI003510BCE6
MRTRNLALVVTAAVVIYLLLLVGRAVELLRSGDPVAVGLGAAVLVLPLLGAWMVVATWRSGVRIQRLARKLEAEDGLPDTSGLPRRPSGRVDRPAADAWFAERRAEVEADPRDWRRWYRLAYAYDIAGDRRRARATMRKAVELEAADTGDD